MNRRDFLKAAFAGLVALVLPKGKREPPCSTVTYADAEAHWERLHQTESMAPDDYGLYLRNGSEWEPVTGEWTVTTGDGRHYSGKGASLKCHTLSLPFYVTTDLIADWEAMGWKPRG